jgi:hypothetical protein
LFDQRIDKPLYSLPIFAGIADEHIVHGSSLSSREEPFNPAPVWAEDL